MPKKRSAPLNDDQPDSKRRSARAKPPAAPKSKPSPKAKPAPKSKPTASKAPQEPIQKSTATPMPTTSLVPPPKSTPAHPFPPRSPNEIRYFLLKAEPDTRIENGIDISFSIDDLASRTSPEPWDGIRNHVAKNNILSMEKGDLAFFYHSNCKVPGIIGTMEIVGGPIPDSECMQTIKLCQGLIIYRNRKGSEVTVL
jgi:EVE domain